MADRMLSMAGSMADGAILWMTGPATVERHIVPLVTKAAAAAPASRTASSWACPSGSRTDPERAGAGQTIWSSAGQLPYLPRHA